MKKGCLVVCLLSLAVVLISMLSATAGIIALHQQIFTPPPVLHLQFGPNDLRLAVTMQPECPPDEGCDPALARLSKQYYASVWNFTTTTGAGRVVTVTGQQIVLIPLGP